MSEASDLPDVPDQVKADMVISVWELDDDLVGLSMTAEDVTVYSICELASVSLALDGMLANVKSLLSAKPTKS